MVLVGEVDEGVEDEGEGDPPGARDQRLPDGHHPGFAVEHPEIQCQQEQNEGDESDPYQHGGVRSPRSEHRARAWTAGSPRHARAPCPLPAAQAGWPACVRARSKRITISRLKAGRSSGLRLDTRLPSTTTSASIHSAPAFLRSVLSEGHEAIRRPRAAPASITGQGPWQITATGPPPPKNPLPHRPARAPPPRGPGFHT